jgi:hypothetical protein
MHEQKTKRKIIGVSSTRNSSIGGKQGGVETTKHKRKTERQMRRVSGTQYSENPVVQYLPLSASCIVRMSDENTSSKTGQLHGTIERCELTQHPGIDHPVTN